MNDLIQFGKFFINPARVDAMILRESDYFYQVIAVLGGKEFFLAHVATRRPERPSVVIVYGDQEIADRRARWDEYNEIEERYERGLDYVDAEFEAFEAFYEVAGRLGFQVT